MKFIKIIGIFLLAIGLIDLLGTYADFDLWGEFIGVKLPDILWQYSAFIEIGLDIYKGLQDHNTPDPTPEKIYSIPVDKWDSVKGNIKNISGNIATISNGEKEYKAKLTKAQLNEEQLNELNK